MGSCSGKINTTKSSTLSSSKESQKKQQTEKISNKMKNQITVNKIARNAQSEKKNKIDFQQFSSNKLQNSVMAQFDPNSIMNPSFVCKFIEPQEEMWNCSNKYLDYCPTIRKVYMDQFLPQLHNNTDNKSINNSRRQTQLQQTNSIFEQQYDI